jgi:hypothetical protein
MSSFVFVHLNGEESFSQSQRNRTVGWQQVDSWITNLDHNIFHECVGLVVRDDDEKRTPIP